MSNLPWAETLRALLRYSSPSQAPVADAVSLCGSKQRELLQSRTEKRSSTVTIIEKLSATTLSLSWRDPTACNYGEQVWSEGKARYASRCALSGAAISKGDLIYRPRGRGNAAPANRAAMILASAVRPTRAAMIEQRQPDCGPCMTLSLDVNT
jgi:hypothetical protein